MATLLEQYKNRIAVAESVYSKAHEGSKLDSNKKLTLATVLNNTNNLKIFKPVPAPIDKINNKIIMFRKI